MIVSTVVFFAMWGYSENIIQYIVENINLQVITVTPFEAITTRVWVSGYLTALVAFPYTVVELYRFISPGLYEKEKISIKIGIPVLYFSYLIGAIVPAYLLIKFILSTLSGYFISDVNNTVSLQSLISFALKTSCVAGLVFCLPAMTGGLTYIKVLNAGIMKRYRKHFIVFACVFSAIVTPPDIISMIIMTVPIIGLFEVSILISKIISGVCKK
jgi:sec-independent protein translocase protein TatC